LFYAYAKLWTGFLQNNMLSNSFVQNNEHKQISKLIEKKKAKQTPPNDFYTLAAVRDVRKMRICDCRIFGTLPHFFAYF